MRKAHLGARGNHRPAALLGFLQYDAQPVAFKEQMLVAARPVQRDHYGDGLIGLELLRDEQAERHLALAMQRRHPVVAGRGLPRRFAFFPACGEAFRELQQAQQGVEGFGAVAFLCALQHIPRVQHGHAFDCIGVVVRFGGLAEGFQPRAQLRDDTEGLLPLAQGLLALSDFKLHFIIPFRCLCQQRRRRARFGVVQCAFADGARLAYTQHFPAQL